MTTDLMTRTLSEALETLAIRAEPYAVATIIRTAGATAAKPGAKAVLSADGTMLHGWLGGGCTKRAVKAAVRAALDEGKPQLISIAPEDLLLEKGLQPGDEVDGVQFARNGCPSRGAIDIFVEPCLPRPELVLFGASPVAEALSRLAPDFEWDLTVATSEESLPTSNRQRAIVIATQGHGDLAALTRALDGSAAHVAFVGSRRKFTALAEKLRSAGVAEARIRSVKAPAGLDIGAVTPEEIALSILAELISVRRKSVRVTDGDTVIETA